MADKIKAYQAYSPKTKSQGMIELNEIGDFIAAHSHFPRSSVLGVMDEIKNAILEFACKGFSIRLNGIGSIAPKIDKNGNFGINLRPDPEIIAELNKPHKYTGPIRNKEMIGKSEDQFIERWNTQHPDDKIKVKKEPGKK